LEDFSIKRKKRFFISEIQKGRCNLGDVVVDRRIILKYIFQKCGVRMWAGFSALCIGSSGGLL
jgi:hypothetical protein